MKKAGKFLLITVTVSIACLYFLSSLTAYLNPADLSFLTIISIGYLPVLIAYIIVMIAWLVIRRRIFLLMLILLFTGYKNLFSTVGFNVLSDSWKWKKDSNAIRVIGWNVSVFGDPYSKNDTAGSTRRLMLQFIREVQPDIFCLQDFRVNEQVGGGNEFVNSTRDIIEAGGFTSVLFPFYYSYNGPNYSDKTGVAVFSRFQAIDTGSVTTGRSLKEERTGYMDILFQEKRLRIYAAHLSSMSLWPNTKEGAGINYLEGDSTKQRAKNIYSKIRYFGELHAGEAQAIKSFMNTAPYPVIFSADLNSVPSSYVYHHLKKGLNDAFLEKDFGIGGTYNRVFPKLRIDVLFHSKELQVVQFTRPPLDLSDHYPVIADIKWKN